MPPETLVRQLHQRALDEARRARAPARPTFSEHEVRVIHLLAAQMTYTEIAMVLGLTWAAVRFDAVQIQRKLGVRSRRRVPVTYMVLTGDDPFPRPEAVVA